MGTDFRPTRLDPYGRVEIWSMRIPYVGGTSNAYLLRSPASVVVLDPGHPEGIEQLKAQLATLSLRPSDVDAFVYSHAHVDHFGNGALVDSPGATHYAGRSTAKLLRSYEDWRIEKIRGVTCLADMFPSHRSGLEGPAMQRFLARFFPELPPLPRVRVADFLEFSDIALKLIPAPGHSKDHMLLHLASDGPLFSGDHVFRNGRVAIGYHSGGSVEDYRRTASTLSKLRPDVVLPGHGPPLVDWPGLLGMAMERIDQELAAVARVSSSEDPLSSLFEHRLKSVGRVYAAANQTAAYLRSGSLE